jgi:hypothetical protein
MCHINSLVVAPFVGHHHRQLSSLSSFLWSLASLTLSSLWSASMYWLVCGGGGGGSSEQS